MKIQGKILLALSVSTLLAASSAHAADEAAPAPALTFKCQSMVVQPTPGADGMLDLLPETLVREGEVTEVKDRNGLVWQYYIGVRKDFLHTGQDVRVVAFAHMAPDGRQILQAGASLEAKVIYSSYNLRGSPVAAPAASSLRCVKVEP